jgi:flagellar hook protein FlgE
VPIDSDMDLSAIALQGLQQTGAQLDAAATRIASFGSTSPDGATLDTVDLSSAVVALMSAKDQFAANLATLKTADEIQQSTLNVMA